jgi:predicted secreted protein
MMRFKVGHWAVAGLVLISVGACAAPSDDTSPSATASAETAPKRAPGADVGPTPEALVVGVAANRTEVLLSPRQSLKVELLATPTAGYLWKVQTLPRTLTGGAESWRPEIERDPNGPQMVGGNSFQAFTFEPGEAGSGDLVLVYGRPWELERGGRPERTFRLTVSVPAE